MILKPSPSAPVRTPYYLDSIEACLHGSVIGDPVTLYGENSLCEALVLSAVALEGLWALQVWASLSLQTSQRQQHQRPQPGLTLFLWELSNSVNITKQYRYFKSFDFGFSFNHCNTVLRTLHKHDQSFPIH